MTVIVYSAPVCPWCDRVKDWLKENNIEFTEIDVSTDKEAAMEMAKKSGQMGVPVIDVDGKIVVGFNQNKLKELLKL